MTERANRFSQALNDTLVRLTTDSSVAPVIAYLKDYERLVLERGMAPESLVPAETDVQAIFRLIQDLRGLAVDVPRTGVRERFMHEVAIARADYLAGKARLAARRSKLNALAAGVAAVCILAGTASIAGAASDLPKITLPVSLQDIVDAISPPNGASQNASETAPASPDSPLQRASGGMLNDGAPDIPSISVADQSGTLAESELRRLTEGQADPEFEGQSLSPAHEAISDPAPATALSPDPQAPGSASAHQTEPAHSAPVGAAQPDSVDHATSQQGPDPVHPVTAPEEPPSRTTSEPENSGKQPPQTGVPGSIPEQSGGGSGQSGAAPGQTGSAPGLNGSAPGLNGTAPGLSGSAPGLGGSVPGPTGSYPSDTGGAAGASGSAPGQSVSTPDRAPASPGDSSFAAQSESSAAVPSATAQAHSDAAPVAGDSTASQDLRSDASGR